MQKRNFTSLNFLKKIIPHLNKEEEVLFPLSITKRLEIKNLVSQLINQHNEIYTLIEKLIISAQPEIELDALGKLLEAHIRKEARELFQILQELFSENELAKLDNVLV